jgi:hypothetical protein
LDDLIVHVLAEDFPEQLALRGFMAPCDLDEVEKELKKATKAIDTAAGLTGKYRMRLQSLCDGTAARKMMPPTSERSVARESANEEIA